MMSIFSQQMLLRERAKSQNIMRFMMALASSAYQLMAYAKYWEMKNKNAKK